MRVTQVSSPLDLRGDGRARDIGENIMHLLDIANEFVLIVSTTFQEPFPERRVEEHVCVVSSLDQHALQQLKYVQKSQNI
jgi:hypothetical protein